jgi:RNA polymerase sigma-70 factor, ECF subfamily
MPEGAWGVAASEWPDLMLRAQSGDQPAYNRLLRAIAPVVRTSVRRRIRDEALAEDVVQDVLLAVHRVRHTYDPDRPFLPWLSAIVSTRAIDALRRTGRHRRREVHDDAIMAMQVDGSATYAIESATIGRDLDRYLSRLPDRQRRMIERVRLQEMSLTEAAAASGETLPTVKSLLHRALLSLRQLGHNDHG